MLSIFAFFSPLFLALILYTSEMLFEVKLQSKKKRKKRKKKKEKKVMEEES